MPQQITFPFLQSVNDCVNLAYETALLSVAPSIYSKFTFEAPSTGAAEVYPLLAGLPQMREWLGDRVVNQLSLSTFSIPNKEWELTFSVKRTDLEDDRLGLLGPASQQLARNTKTKADLLIAQLMKNGHTSLTYDGQNFFDVAHPNYTDTGAPTTVANYQAGAGPSWYLLDISQIARAFIYQLRRPPQIIPKFSLTDPAVFFNNEYVWGADMRSNAGYGLWHFSFRSDAAMTQANILAARLAMASLHTPDGVPMGLGTGAGTLLVAPTALFPTARGYAQDQFDPNPPTAGTLAPNEVRGLVQAVENVWLN